jgi:RNA polymerase sigma-70 factor (ECF subfamily)
MQTLMPETGPSKSLVEKARQGDRAAFEALAAAMRGQLESYLRGRIRSHLRHQLDVEDLVQETFARALESMDRFEGSDDGAFAGWITGIGKKVLLKAIEKSGRARPLKLERDPIAAAPSPSQALRRDERLEHLERCLGALSADHQEVVRLARLDGLPLEEVARRMGRSPAAAKKLLWRALKDLKQTFGDTESLHLPPRPLGPEGRPHGD